MTSAITLDFHNTLARCDAWFDLEVRHLPTAFLRWRASDRGEALDLAREVQAQEAYRRLRHEIAAHGRELTAERCVEIVMEELEESVLDADIDRGVAVLMRETFVEVAPLDGALELVAELATAGVPLAVISNAVYHQFLEWSLEQFGIRDAFTAVVTSASTGYYKSQPEIYATALAAIGATPRGSVHVGDSLRWDVGTARRAGMRTVWLKRPDEPDDDTADLVLPTLVGSAPSILALFQAPHDGDDA